MKKFLLSLAFSILSISIYAQCDAPVVESWSAPSIDDITVNFTVPSDAQAYTLEITGEYGFSPLDYEFNAPLILTGMVSSGLNAVNFDVSDVISSNYGPLENYYYSASLSVVCANGDSSSINHFYVSAFSLLNDPGYNTGDIFFKPMTLLPDLIDVSFDTYISVPASDFSQEIDSISVFIDLGHTFNGDLSIELISPMGTTVTLLPSQNGLSGSKGLSVIFNDTYPLLSPINNSQGYRGIYSPAEPLSALAGQNAEGLWIVRVVDNISSDYGMLFGVGLSINSSPCLSSFSGKAFYDLNANNLQDEEEPGLSNAIIHNSLDNQDILSNSTGHFTDCSISGSGALSLINTPTYYTAANVSFSVSDGEFLSDLDFPIQPIPGNNDLKVDLFATGPDRPGFPNTYILNYQNIGTDCIDDVDIHINMDALLLISDCENGDVIFSGNTADLQLSQLCPLEGGSFYLSTYLNDTVSIGTELNSTATISPLADDQNSANNVSAYHSVVVGAYDPNDKTVSTATINPSFVQSGLPLKYIVRFQNTGNYYAERVLIVDTLDANLDPNSFVLTSTSHDVNITRNGSIFYFEYANIFLPDSNTNEPDSHGYIRYEVKAIAGMDNGEAIYNTASIFFDFNAPIVTNTVTTVMDFSSGVNDLTYEANVYPNPAQNRINLEWLPTVRIEEINLFDLTGKKIKSYSVLGTHRAEINVEKLAAGAYIFQFIGADVIKPVVWMKN